jgi:hypothetical protein
MEEAHTLQKGGRRLLFETGDGDGREEVKVRTRSFAVLGTNAG